MENNTVTETSNIYIYLWIVVILLIDGGIVAAGIVFPPFVAVVSGLGLLVGGLAILFCLLASRGIRKTIARVTQLEIDIANLKGE